MSLNECSGFAETVGCFACKCNTSGVMPSTSFIAGIAFALQFNAKAIASRLCEKHRAALAMGHLGTRNLVKSRQERR